MPWMTPAFREAALPNPWLSGDRVPPMADATFWAILAGIPWPDPLPELLDPDRQAAAAAPLRALPLAELLGFEAAMHARAYAIANRGKVLGLPHRFQLGQYAVSRGPTVAAAVTRDDDALRALAASPGARAAYDAVVHLEDLLRDILLGIPDDAVERYVAEVASPRAPTPERFVHHPVHGYGVITERGYDSLTVVFADGERRLVGRDARWRG